MWCIDLMCIGYKLAFLSRCIICNTFASVKKHLCIIICRYAILLLFRKLYSIIFRGCLIYDYFLYFIVCIFYIIHYFLIKKNIILLHSISLLNHRFWFKDRTWPNSYLICIKELEMYSMANMKNYNLPCWVWGKIIMSCL